MTDILDLEGWNVVSKYIDGDDYLIEAEYTVPPKACTKCGNIGNLYKHGPKPIYIRDSPIRGRPVRIIAHARSHEQLQPERNFFKFGRRSIDRRSAIDRVLASGGILRGDDGLAGRVDGLGAVGQGQVPAVVAAAWSTLSCF